jgi:hypothetical protein
MDFFFLFLSRIFVIDPSDSASPSGLEADSSPGDEVLGIGLAWHLFRVSGTGSPTSPYRGPAGTE